MLSYRSVEGCCKHSQNLFFTFKMKFCQKVIFAFLSVKAKNYKNKAALEWICSFNYFQMGFVILCRCLQRYSVFVADSILKREKRLRTRRVHFENVTVYYFTRRQGFTSVPSQGGSTLGMSSRHTWVRQYSLGEFALEQERIHKDMLRDHLKEEKLNSIKLEV